MSTTSPHTGPITDTISPSITIRRGHLDDSLAAFRVHHHAIEDLFQRMSLVSEEARTDEEFQKEWNSIRSLYEYLARSADEFWVAERDGEVVGYARSCSHAGVRALTEFFVDPSAQSQGVGKALVTRAFPGPETAPEMNTVSSAAVSAAAQVRFVIATPESAAQSLYMRSGVYARNLIYRMARAPQATDFSSDLMIEAAPNTPATLAHLAAIDSAILGFQRDNNHQWLLADRQAWLYRRQGEVVGYGYTGEANGPFALLNAADYPAVLAHAENQAVAAGRQDFALWVHSTNRHAIDYLMAKRFKVGRIFATFLTNVPFGQFDHYINTDPLFLL